MTSEYRHLRFLILTLLIPACSNSPVDLRTERTSNAESASVEANEISLSALQSCLAQIRPGLEVDPTITADEESKICAVIAKAKAINER